MSSEYTHTPFLTPADKIKTFDVPPIPQHIFDGMSKYEEAARGFSVFDFERVLPTATRSSARIYLAHRPADAQVRHIYRIPSSPSDGNDIERLTYFDTGTGRRITGFHPIIGDDWRGVWRGGGAVMVMDLDGNEKAQLWRYWEDSECEGNIPKVDGELDNRPGIGRIERITQDGHKYTSPVISWSNKYLVFSCNREGSTDSLVYISRLTDSNTGAHADSSPFHLPSKVITPKNPTEYQTVRWSASSISIDDRYVLLTNAIGSSYQPLYIVDMSGNAPTPPKHIKLPGATETEEYTNPARPHLVYLITDAFGEFRSVTVQHITTPGAGFGGLRPIPWGMQSLQVTPEIIFFSANVEGWDKLFYMPLSGMHKDVVTGIQHQSDAAEIAFKSNARNGCPNQLVLTLWSHRVSGSLAHVDITPQLDEVLLDSHGKECIMVEVTGYKQATPKEPAFRTLPPKLIRYRSFDDMDIPAMYYHPGAERGPVAVVISIHGGPESQATAVYTNTIHGYLLNELNFAVIYPNVRGSSGYDKKFLSADDVYKREDSVKDIGALIEYIKREKSDEIDSNRIAACMAHFSPILACGVATCGIAHYPSFLTSTAPYRVAHRRREYGDERDPEVLKFLERISPLNNAEMIRKPMWIAHGENDVRVTVDQAYKMWRIVKGNGVPAELIVGEMEGHGFRQKSVIEFTNAAKVHFLERFLV
ncbi:alpha/beta-hydrolase [Rickenella mellea]|uniref:Dipeptidyl-peptidase V n=1 Tax=Rickenella mellea TaxID=50990 RepID=A0A4Y7Q4I7_9AGAM|nr:alpha/beta-hydrolase [Rickenella mellea]